MNVKNNDSQSAYSLTLTMIVPVFNRAQLVGNTLESIRLQTRRPDELILVDNNSTDGTMDVLLQWQRRLQAEGWKVTVVEELRPGAANARQTGFELCTTDCVMFFDSDDIMNPDHVEKSMAIMEQFPELDMNVWGLRAIWPDGHARLKRVLPRHIVSNHMVQALLATQAYVVKSDFLRKAGGWNRSMHGWDDWELGVRLLLARPEIFVSTDVRIDQYVSEQSITGLDYSHRTGQWESAIDEAEGNIVRFMETDSSSRLNPEMMLRLIAYRRAVLAAHYWREGNPAARELYSKAISSPWLNAFQRLAVKAAYHYIRMGIPAAGGVFPPLLW